MISDDGWKNLGPQEFLKRIQPQPIVDHPLEHRLTQLQHQGLADNLRRQLIFMGPRGAALEIEALDYRRSASDGFPKTRASHAITDEDAVRLCAEADEWLTQGVYLLHARLKEGVETRHCTPGRWFDIPKSGGTTDSDVEARLVLAIDFDVDRPKGTSATDEELRRSIHVALSAWNYLSGALEGTDSMAYVHSGNGRQIHLALDSLPNDENSKIVMAGLLVGLDTLLSTSQVKVDRKLFDAKRILPACGTVKRKGTAGIESRPHRRTAIVTPESVVRLSEERLRQLARQIWNDTTDDGRAAMNQAFGVKEKVSPISPARDSPYGAANAVPPEDVAQWLGLYDGSDVRCPGCGETSGVAVLRLGLKCHHNRCADRGRGGFRTNVDLVAEVHRVSPKEAVLQLAERFSFDASNLSSESPAPRQDAPHFSKPERITWIETAEIFAPLPPTKWLVPSLHLVAGRPTLLAGYGFSGKTLMAQAMAVALAAAHPVWGSFAVSEAQQVRHFDYEQGKHATLKRYQRLCVGLGISQRELGSRLQVAIFPDVYLDDRDATDSYSRACEGVSIVVLDALRGATPTIDENDSTIRRCLDNLSRVSEKTGTAFLVLHHAGKVARDDPRAQPRGSSAIFDAAGCVFVVNGGRNEPKEVQQTKSPAEAEGGALENFYLVIEDVAVDDRPTAGLRVKVQATAEAQAQSGTSAKFLETKRSVLSMIASTPGLSSGNALYARHKGNRPDVMQALAELRSEGRVNLVNGELVVSNGVTETSQTGTNTKLVPTDTKTQSGTGTSTTTLKGGTGIGGHAHTARDKTLVSPTERESVRKIDAMRDADMLASVPQKERVQWCATQGWSDTRSRRARGALAYRESVARRDAEELQKIADSGLDPAARATELGWEDERIATAVRLVKPPRASETPSAPTTLADLVEAMVSLVADYPKITKATLGSALGKKFGGDVDVDAVVEATLATERVTAVANKGMRSFILAEKK